jgi:excisionase family DNA binding protein
MRKSELIVIDVTRDDYSTKEIAELVGVSASYIRRVLFERKSVLRGRNIGGRLWLVSGQSLKLWLEQREERE